MSAQIFNFKKQPLREEEKLVLNRGQRDMILDYVEARMMRAEASKDYRTAEEFSNIHNMLWVFCQPEEK